MLPRIARLALLVASACVACASSGCRIFECTQSAYEDMIEKDPTNVSIVVARPAEVVGLAIAQGERRPRPTLRVRYDDGQVYDFTPGAEGSVPARALASGPLPPSVLPCALVCDEGGQWRHIRRAGRGGALGPDVEISGPSEISGTALFALGDGGPTGKVVRFLVAGPGNADIAGNWTWREPTGFDRDWRTARGWAPGHIEVHAWDYGVVPDETRPAGEHRLFSWYAFWFPTAPITVVVDIVFLPAEIIGSYVKTHEEQHPRWIGSAP